MESKRTAPATTADLIMVIGHTPGKKM